MAVGGNSQKTDEFDIFHNYLESLKFAKKNLIKCIFQFTNIPFR